jgi:hypothetical protein
MLKEKRNSAAVISHQYSQPEPSEYQYFQGNYGERYIGNRYQSKLSPYPEMSSNKAPSYSSHLIKAYSYCSLCNKTPPKQAKEKVHIRKHVIDKAPNLKQVT